MPKIFKKSISLLLAVLLILSLVPTGALAAGGLGANPGMASGGSLVPSNGTWTNMANGMGTKARFLRISLVEFPDGQNALTWQKTSSYKVRGSINVYNKGFETINKTAKLSYYHSTAVDHMIKGVTKTLEDSACHTTLTSGAPDASDWISCEEFASYKNP